MPRVKPALCVSVLADAHVAGGDAGNRAVLEQHFGGGKARIDLDAERFGLSAPSQRQTSPSETMKLP